METAAEIIYNFFEHFVHKYLVLYFSIASLVFSVFSQYFIYEDVLKALILALAVPVLFFAIVYFIIFAFLLIPFDKIFKKKKS